MEKGNILLDGKVILSHSLNSLSDIADSVSSNLRLSLHEFYFTQNGKLANEATCQCHGNLHLHLRLVGGKGGFGSMLRAIGAQIEKTTNREACRDLSGRRLRDINEEKRMKAWLDKQKEREEEAAAKTSKKIEKLQSKPKHEFKDKQYDEARSELTQTVHDALEEGLKKAAETSSGKGSGESSGSENGAKPVVATKRKTADKCKKAKKKIKGAQWLDDGLGSSSDSDSDSGSEGGSSDSKPSTSSSGADGKSK